ncbi:monovalent cation/H(+) antiporter subunit G [Kamptonema cortianum]|nr:monovalent cation/H(+) antiporter subunit G [Geitlerinema splendidum]MDK3158489.1 monovalent cation/H(+) antiporter subunit G [Kamptonema cortianum]
MADIPVILLLGLGCLFVFLAALGLVRMPDFYNRMQAMTKGTTLGVGLVMLAVTIHFGGGPAGTRALAVVLFLFATAPVGAHMLARAAYLLGVEKWSGTRSDALIGVYFGKSTEHTPEESE